MAILENWSNNVADDATLNATTHGSGTTAERTAITSWPGSRPFFDTDKGKFYRNSHGAVPSSVTWTEIGSAQAESAEQTWENGSVVAGEHPIVITSGWVRSHR